MLPTRWQDWVSLVLGAFLAASPWGMGYSHVDFATWNAVAVGLAIVIVSITDIDWPSSWEEWLNLALGIWLIVSPLAMGFESQPGAAWSAVVVGILVTVFASWAMSLDKEIEKWWQERVNRR